MANENVYDAQHVIESLLVCTDYQNYTCLDCNRYCKRIEKGSVDECVHDLMLEAVHVLKMQHARIVSLETVLDDAAEKFENTDKISDFDGWCGK